MQDNIDNELNEVVEEQPIELEEELDEGEEIPEEELEEVAEEVKTVPLIALQKEREKLRSLKKQLSDQSKILNRVMEGAGARDPKELESRMDELTLKDYIENQGYDENTARLFLMQQKENAKLKSSLSEVSYKEELAELKDNPFYSDIEEVKEDVFDYAKAKGLTVRESYNALFGEQRALELQSEKKSAQIQEKKNNKRIAALSSSGNSTENKNSIKLSADERAYAEAAGMTPEDYAKYK